MIKDRRKYFLSQKKVLTITLSFLISLIFLFIFELILKNNYETYLDISLYKSEFLTCLPKGWTDIGTKSFWQFYFYPELPTLQDAFEDNGKLTIILSCMLLNTHFDYFLRVDNLFRKKWVLYLHQGNSPVYKDYPINRFEPIFGRVVSKTDEQKILVIQFELPEKYQNQFNFATIQTAIEKKKEKIKYRPFNSNEVTNQRIYRNGETELQGYQNYTKLFMNRINEEDIEKYGLSYRNIPFCPIIDSFSIYSKRSKRSENSMHSENSEHTELLENSKGKDFLRICTENLIFTDKERNVDLLRWALYHKDQGFGIPIVYYNKIINEDNRHPQNFKSYFNIKEKAMQTLKKAIDNDVIELVSWEFPYAFYFHDQLGQEASCIYRNKGRTKWLGINDVDEFFYNPNPKTKDTINVTMEKIAYKNFAKDFGGIIAPNVWMKYDKNDGKVYQDDYFSQYERTKCIIIPDNVYAYHVHTVNNGLPTVSFNKNNVVNAHFKVVSEDTYYRLFYSEKMTHYYNYYTKLAKEYLGLTTEGNEKE